MDFLVSHHMRYQRVNDATMIRTLAAKRVRYGFDLFLGAEEPANRGYQKVVRHQWRKYGREVFAAAGHLAMPLEEYVKTVYGVVSRPMDPAVQAPVAGFADHGVFLDFDLGGRPVGGMVASLGVLGFGDALWNFEFWNNVRDASGMYYWGRKLNVPELVVRGADRQPGPAGPQNTDGFFAPTYLAASGRWLEHARAVAQPYFDLRQDQSRLRRAGDEQDGGPSARIPTAVRKGRGLSGICGSTPDGLIARIGPDGNLPSYYTPDMRPLDALRRSAQPAASL